MAASPQHLQVFVVGPGQVGGRRHSVLYHLRRAQGQGPAGSFAGSRQGSFFQRGAQQRGSAWGEAHGGAFWGKQAGPGERWQVLPRVEAPPDLQHWVSVLQQKGAGAARGGRARAEQQSTHCLMQGGRVSVAQDGSAVAQAARAQGGAQPSQVASPAAHLVRMSSSISRPSWPTTWLLCNPGSAACRGTPSGTYDAGGQQLNGSDSVNLQKCRNCIESL